MGSPISKEVMTEDEIIGTVARDRSTLVLSDRCDRCGAQAFVVVRRGSQSALMFCGHHFAKHEAALVGHGWEIQDERDKINLNPSISANAE